MALSRRKTRFGRPRTFPLALALRRPVRTRFPSHLPKSGQNVQHEARHGVFLVRVDILGHRQETHVQRDQFLDRADAVGDRAALAVDLPNEHGIEPANSGIIGQPVEFGKAGLGSTPAGRP